MPDASFCVQWRGGGVLSRWESIFEHQTVGVTEDSWFISGCLVKEKPVPGQKHQGEQLVETLFHPTPTSNFIYFLLFPLQKCIRRFQGGRTGRQASLATFHLEHEDHLIHGAHRDDEGDPKGPGRQQLRLRAARTLPAVLRPRRRAAGQPGPVGDGGVQVAPFVSQRRALQEDIGHVHRL